MEFEPATPAGKLAYCTFPRNYYKV